MARNVTLDIETYWAKNYTLSGRGKNSITMEEYINDPRFKMFGIGVKVDDGPSRWFTEQQFIDRIGQFRQLFKSSACIAQNSMFDMAALAWHYDCQFGLIIDTKSMALPLLGPEHSVSLKTLAEHYGVGVKGTELMDTKGKRELTDEEMAVLGRYCCNDVDLTWEIYKKMRVGFPKEEIALIDHIMRMYVEPAFRVDAPLLRRFHAQEVLTKAKFLEKLDTSREVLQSNDKFAQLLLGMGVEPPMKYSVKQKKDVYAFAKSDPEFMALLEYPDEKVQMVVEARLGQKSTLGETRSLRLANIADRNDGYLPNAKKYCGAHTHRMSGCVVADTKVTVYDYEQGITEKNITDVLLDDLVWDGEEFVQHEGVVFSGFAETITWDGITGTKNHVVFTKIGEITLFEAMQGQHRITVAAEPTENALDSFRKHSYDKDGEDIMPV